MTLLMLACTAGEETGIDSAEPVPFEEVEALFGRACAASGCHGGDTVEAQLSLDAGKAWPELVEVPSTQLPAMLRVHAGDPEESYLVHKLAGTQEDVGGSGDAMPPGLGVSEDEIELVRSWIAGGAAGSGQLTPAVTITAPADGSSTTSPVTVTLELADVDLAAPEAAAGPPPPHESAADDPVAYVAIGVDGEVVAQVAEREASLELDPGEHVLDVELFWPDGDAFYPEVTDEVAFTVK